MKRQPVDKYAGPYTPGIDVSRYQGEIDWDKVAQTVNRFAIIRTGDGKGTDAQFDRNWKHAKRVGLIRGSYHYFRADRGGKEQAGHVIKMINDAGGMEDHDFPPVIDIEAGTAKNLAGGVYIGATSDLPADMIAEECLEYLECIEAAFGVVPMVYTGQAFHWWFSQARPEIAAKFAKYPLWLPSYVAEPRRPLMPVDKEGNAFPWEHWTIWQYTSKNLVNGIQGNVDGNRFRGDEAQMHSFIKSLRVGVTPSPVPDMSDVLFAEANVLMKQLQEVLDELAEVCKS